MALLSGISCREQFGSRVISTIETYDLVGKVKALTFVGAFLFCKCLGWI